MNKGRKILIDADVVSHFIKGEEYKHIHLIFPKNKIYILDKVHLELQNWPSPKIQIIISQLLTKKYLELMEFPENNIEILKEYAWIKKMQFRVDGESACLAVARYNKQILDSSNLKDIKNYCITHKID